MAPSSSRTRTTRATPATIKTRPSKRKLDGLESGDVRDEGASDEDRQTEVDRSTPKKKAKLIPGRSKKQKLHGHEGEDGEDFEPEKNPGGKGARRQAKPRPRKSKLDAYDSDMLDEDTPPASGSESEGGSNAKTKTKSPSKGASKPKRGLPKKRVAKKGSQDSEDGEDETCDTDLKEGQSVVGKVVQAPTSGRVPPGQISQNTLDFLKHLKDPACNDREWFKLQEPVYRVAEKEWKDFVDGFTEVLMEMDPQVPQLPPKDVIHRIYRDIRFSNDKTPYKCGFSATFSRGGRKGIFAKYHICVKPGNETFIAAGLWCPGRNELANVRTNIQISSTRFRRVISSPTFVRYFGEAKPSSKGERQNIFGGEDELKVAPKGVEKEHKDIDILKCRTFAVMHRFTDSEVLDPKFKQHLGEVGKVLKPFVYVLNDLLMVGGGGGGSDSEDEEDGEEEQGGGEEDEPEEGDEGAEEES